MRPDGRGRPIPGGRGPRGHGPKDMQKPEKGGCRYVTRVRGVRVAMLNITPI